MYFIELRFNSSCFKIPKNGSRVVSILKPARDSAFTSWTQSVTKQCLLNVELQQLPGNISFLNRI